MPRPTKCKMGDDLGSGLEKENLNQTSQETTASLQLKLVGLYLLLSTVLVLVLYISYMKNQLGCVNDNDNQIEGFYSAWSCTP